MEESDFLKAAEASNQRFATLSGIDYLRAVLADGAGYPFAQLLKLHLASAGDGVAEIEATTSYAFYNPMMRIHGGYLASLVDACLGSAVITKLPKGAGAGTVQLNINYVRKVDIESGKLKARGEVLHAGRTMLTGEAHIYDAKGQLCVHGTGTFLVYPK